MPISEDEYDLRQGQEAQSTMSKAELRKVNRNGVLNFKT